MRVGRTTRVRRASALVVTLLAGVASASLSACGDDGGDDGDLTFVEQIPAAVAAVEAELGAGQQFFEVTASPQLTNVFVAVDDATSAIPYVFVDGELQPPAPALEGASGSTFGVDAIDFDEATILDRIADELPDATIESLSVEGGPDGTVRYVASVRSAAGGLLDVVVAPDGAVLEVGAA